MKSFLNFSILILLVALTACGGGGSDTLTSPPQPPVNQAPTASAPIDFSAIELSNISLDGTSSSDSDGSIDSYAWSQTGGLPSVTLNGATTATATFTAPDVAADTPLTFSLTVTDDDGATASDSVVVTIRPDQPTQAVSFSGKITYDSVQHNASNGLDYNNIVQSSIRGATVELLNSSASSIFDTTTSDGNGDYSFMVTPNSSYVIRVKAELKKTAATPTWDFTVVDNTNSQALYAMDSSAQAVAQSPVIFNINADSGWTGTAYGNTRVAGPFAILDAVYQAKEKITGVDATVIFAPLKLNWSINNTSASGDSNIGQIGTSFFNGSEIFLLGDADGDTDEYDDHVIIHEWGHYFEGRLSRSDSVGGSHGGGDFLDMRVALGEGWGNALSGIVTDDPLYRDSFGSGQSSGFQIDVESGATTSVGWYSESSAYLLIYDFYDANDDGADTLSLGFAPLYNLMVGGEKTTPAFTSIFSFVNQLKAISPSSAATIDNMLTAQNIVVTDDFGTGETNNGGDARNLPVYQALPIGGSVEVCSYGTKGQQNKLGNRKYLTVDITNSGSYTITAVGQTAGDDPDLFLYLQGSLVFRSDAIGNESTTQTINAGQYVMEVYEFSNVQGTVRDTCIDVTLTAN